MKKQYQYSEKDGNGNLIWINYDPKKYIPQSDTRVINIRAEDDCQLGYIIRTGWKNNDWKEHLDGIG